MRNAVLLIPLLSATALAAAPKPPAQPKTGPGGQDYAHAKVTRSVFGAGVDQFWIFEPDEPRPKSAPVVVFNHGWLAMQPVVYLAWIHHLVQRGNIVIYPRYQEGPLTMPWTFAANATKAVKRALQELGANGRVKPELERFAMVGHSAGAAITADMAALAAKSKLPTPKALMIVQPGRGMRDAKSAFFPAADYSKIPKDVLMLVVVGEDDRIVGDVTGKDIFRNTPQIPLDRKDFVIVRTDRHGDPPLVADHVSPCCPMRPNPVVVSRRTNALDYLAYWRLFDALTDAAFHGKPRSLALGNTPQQRSLGTWSDGTPIKELLVTDEP